MRNLIISLVVLLTLASQQSVVAANNCVYSTVGNTMLLQGDCATDAPIIIPAGMIHDGQGHKITAGDPSGGHFKGGILQNGGSTASVVNTVIETVSLADVCDAGADRLRGILFDGASGAIRGNTILAVNQNPSASVLSGCQEGNGIEVRNFGSFAGTIQADITENTVLNYQKTGIVVNGAVSASITGNMVVGAGPQSYIAQNGIQVGFGATARVKKNLVSGNSYSGNSAASGGLLLVAGPGYGSDYSVGDQFDGNVLIGNDVGVFVSQIDGSSNPPATATNVKVVNNIITNTAVTNGFVYQAGVSDQGNNDKIINNAISGAGYDPATLPGSTFAVDADSSFTNRPKVHANR